MILILTLRVFATAMVINLLKPGVDQKCILKDNCFRTPNYPNPYIAAECYAEVINAARVLVWSKHFQLFDSEDGREYKRDTLTIQFADSAKSSLSFFADNGPNNIELSRGDRFIRASTVQRNMQRNCAHILFVLKFDFDFCLHRLTFTSYPPIGDVGRNQTGLEVCVRIQAPFFQKFNNYVCNLGEDDFFVNDGQNKLSFEQCETKCAADNQCKFFEYWQRVP